MGIIIILVILLIIIVLLFSSVRANIKYHNQMTVNIEYLFLSFQVFPKKPPKKNKRKDAENDEEEKKFKIVNFKKFISFVQRMIKLVSGIIKDILKKSKINLLKIKIVVGSDDAAQTAIQYGEACAIVGSALGFIKAIMPIKKYNINITPDFTNAEFSLNLNIIISVRINTLLGVLIKYGALFVTTMRHNTMKGGTAK
jgi:hypothetical protein